MSDIPEQNLPKAFIYIEFKEPESTAITDMQIVGVPPVLMLGVCSMLETEAKIMIQKQRMMQEVQVPDSRTAQQILRVK